MSSEDHVVSRQSFAYNISPIYPRGYKPPVEEQKIVGDSLFIQKKLNDWTLLLDVNEYGKLTLIGEKSLGRIGTIKVTVETREDTTPKVKLMPLPQNIYTHEGKYIEVDDRKQRTNEEFKKEDNDEYERQYLGSSIVTPTEFFSEMVPSFQNLLENRNLNETVSKISNEVSEVSKPSRSYVKEK